MGSAAVRRADGARHARHAHVHGQAAAARGRAAAQRLRHQGQDGAAAARAAGRPPAKKSA